MRIRLHFAKTDAMRYTSHLDLHRAWERTIRRAGLPLAYTQGFRPHPRINLASALPLGFTSLDEVVDIWLETELPLEQLNFQLAKSLPPGLQVKSIEEVEAHLPALQVELLASEYQITLLEAVPDLDQQIEAVRSAETLPRVWRNKQYDLRPLIIEVQRIEDDPRGQQRLRLLISARESATGRPEEVILAVGGQPALARVQRTHLVFRQLDHPVLEGAPAKAEIIRNPATVLNSEETTHKQESP